MTLFIHVIIISIFFFFFGWVRIGRMASFEKICYNLCVLYKLREKRIFLKYTTIKFEGTKTSRNKEKRKLKEKWEA